jgi:hypothetical protein
VAGVEGAGPVEWPKCEAPMGEGHDTPVEGRRYNIFIGLSLPDPNTQDIPQPTYLKKSQ